jgi:hypothetical protein
MTNAYPMEQETLEQVRPRDAESRAALENKLDQARPAADNANASSANAASDNQTLKNELPAKQYDARIEASAHLDNIDKSATDDKNKWVVQADDPKINELLAHDPEKTTAMAGKDHHLSIQKELTQKGEYDRYEVKATNEHGQEAKRIREITRGKNTGEIREEGTVYDLYRETDNTIYTGEIKPFSPTGIKEAELKLEKQIDIEENFGGNHGGKAVERELIFYDPRDSSIVLRGPADAVLQQAKDLAQLW